MAPNEFINFVEKFWFTENKVLYKGKEHKAIDYNVTEAIIYLAPFIEKKPDLDNTVWVTAENCIII